jgi:alpha-1,6-mannosyltransferase
MKIVDIAEAYSSHGGGIRTYVHHKLLAAQRAGHHVVIVAPGEHDGRESHPGGVIEWVKGPRVPFDRRYGLFVSRARLLAIVDRERPDIVEASSPWGGGWFGGRVRTSAPRVLVFHTDPVAVGPETLLGARLGFDRVERWAAPMWAALRRLASPYDAVIVSGEWLKRRLEQHGVARVRVVPFGIDTGGFSPHLHDPALRADLLSECGAPKDAQLVAIVGRLDPEKRLPVLLEAFARAARVRPLGLVVFGRGSQERTLRRAIARTPGARWMGYIRDRRMLARTLASADAFLHGSAAETYGLDVAEALCAGTPAVIPDRGGASAFATPGATEAYAAGDARAACKALLAVLARDRSENRRACAIAARSVPSIDEHFERLWAAYASLRAGTPCTEATFGAVSLP